MSRPKPRTCGACQAANAVRLVNRDFDVWACSACGALFDGWEEPYSIPPIFSPEEFQQLVAGGKVRMRIDPNARPEPTQLREEP